MPLYEFGCHHCGETHERTFKIADCPEYVQCIFCDKQAHKIISKSSIQCDSINDVSWLESAERVIKLAHEKPWTSRRDYLDCLNRNGLEPGR